MGRRVFMRLDTECSRTTTLEGYGVTECSPVVSVNREENPRPFTIGRVLPSVEHAIVDVETNRRRVECGEMGMLVVRGPSVFRGYLGETASPFVHFEEKDW